MPAGRGGDGPPRRNDLPLVSWWVMLKHVAKVAAHFRGMDGSGWQHLLDDSAGHVRARRARRRAVRGGAQGAPAARRGGDPQAAAEVPGR